MDLLLLLALQMPDALEIRPLKCEDAIDASFGIHNYHAGQIIHNERITRLQIFRPIGWRVAEINLDVSWVRLEECCKTDETAQKHGRESSIFLSRQSEPEKNTARYRLLTRGLHCTDLLSRPVYPVQRTQIRVHQILVKLSEQQIWSSQTGWE